MSQPVSLAARDAIAVITIDNPPVNALSPGVPEGLLACVEQFQSDDTLRAAVLICAGRTFIAGADIREFQRITSGERDPDLGLNPILNYIEACPKPIVCAIHGTALGGGLEVAMACHFRIAAAGAKFGQPEVKLGLIPGAGGTQRLPRLVGVAKAAEMCALGEPIEAEDARRHGLVGEISLRHETADLSGHGRGGTDARWTIDLADAIRAVPLSPADLEYDDSDDYEIEWHGRLL